MDFHSIVSSLAERFPGKTIVRLPKEKPTEIICEVEPYTAHPDWSLAIAFIGESLPHYHLKSIETYEVVTGELTLFIEGKPHVLKKGESFTVHPPKVHFAKGNWTEVRVYSKPGWKPSDHILHKEGR